jgi:hypothetical protein
MSSGASSETRLTRIFAAALTAIAGACAAPAMPESPFYESGFADGCATASAETAPVPRAAQRDEALYAKDSGYRSGWISGHASCRMPSGPPRL